LVVLLTVIMGAGCKVDVTYGLPPDSSPPPADGSPPPADSGPPPADSGPPPADAAPLLSYPEEVLADSPILYLRLDEMAGPVDDTSGHGHDGNPLAGVTLGQPSPIASGSAARFSD